MSAATMTTLGEHVADLVAKGSLLHTARCSKCRAIMALPIGEQKALVVAAGPRRPGALASRSGQLPTTP